MEIRGDYSVDSHVLEYLLEWRDPVLALGESLNRVAPVPVGRQGPVAGNGGKAIPVSEAQSVFECCLGSAIRHDIEDPSAGPCPVER